MNLKNFFVTAAALVMMATGLKAQEAQVLPLDPEVRYGKLENGLTYYIRHNEEPKNLVNFYIAQKVGSVQEEDSQRGLAHFLEHMCFNGSENFKEDGALIKYCESIGVKFGQNLNAYTSTDETVYNIDDVPVTESNIDSCLLIIHDWADGLLLLPSEIDKERGVIHEEWRMRSSASQRILERALPLIYPGSKYGNRMPIGLMEVVDNFEPQVLRDYYETWYRPDLQGVVIVGDIDVDQVEAKVKKLFGPIKAQTNPKEYVDYPVPSNDHAIYVIEKDKEQQMPTLIMFYKTEPLPREQRGTMLYYMQDYMVQVITSVLNSRLSELTQKPDCPFVVAQVGYGNYLVSKTMEAIEVDIIPQEGRTEEAVKAVMTELERARRHGLTATEVIRAREEILSQVETIYNNRNKQRSSYFVNQYVRHFLDGNATPGIEFDYQIYNALAPQIPAEAINQTLAGILESTDKDFVVLGMYPEKDGVVVPSADLVKNAIASAVSQDIEAYVDNVKDEPLVPVLPKKGKVKKSTKTNFGYTKLTLSNGANVFYKKTDFNESQVVFRAFSFGGMSLLPESDMVNAKLMGDVINSQGLGAFNTIELEKALAGKQVACSVTLSQVAEQLSGSSTPKDLETLMQLIYLRFQDPTDEPDVYNNIINTYRAQLANASKLPTSALQDTINSTVYKGNVRVASLHLEDLDKADYAAIKRIYKERFSCGGDFNFYFTGNFDEAQLVSLVEQYIAPLAKAKKKEGFKKHGLIPAEGVITNKFSRQMETPQAYIVQLYSGDQKYTNKDAAIVNALGSILSQRYIKEIREDRGLTYSVNTTGALDYGEKDVYMFQTVCPFTPTEGDLVLQLMRAELDKIAAEGVKESELEDVRKFELKDLADSERNNAYWTNIILHLVEWGHNNYDGTKEAIESVSSADVQNFVKNVLLKQNNCTTVVMLPEE